MSDVTDAPAVPPMPENPPAPGRRWPHPLVMGLAGLAIGAGAVGLAWGLSGSGSSTPTTFTLNGTMTLTGDNIPTGDTNEDCTGYSGYDDIAKGASVTVYDSTGKVVATGSLGTGKPKSAACGFPVAVPGVPEGSKFYQVEVSHRGKITVSSAEAKAGKFAASLG
ncbi:hypothetical protein [Streptomyces mirabilis]|uniref:hypothetical protein n=1 Tax=Streptomyces mirabilis TaxID=68239 RepID=UPI0036A74A8B